MAKTVLIVDDSSSLRTVVKMALLRAGYEVLEGVDGRDGLAQLDKAAKVHLIVSDVNMPNMDGLELTRQLRALPSFARTPIILLTTESDPAKKILGRAAGATGWIVKPFSQEQLLAIVAKVLPA